MTFCPKKTSNDEVSLPFKPIVYQLNKQKDKDGFEELLQLNPTIQIYDTIQYQLRELIKIDNPEKNLSINELDQLIPGYLNNTAYKFYGNWVYYPWLQKVVHLVPEEEFIRIRTNRNMYKITPGELTTLRNKKIGIIGLSVGQSIALTIATERICGELRLADFDTIELSNMNRLSNSNVFDLGASKVITTARRIAEMDPYIHVKCWAYGIDENNIDNFLQEDGATLDILVEECDSIDVKILSRIKAREKGIPVVMDTNDKGMLDIERFDIEPERPILHGRIKELEGIPIPDLVKKLKGLTIEEKIGFLAKIIGMENVSEEMKTSLAQMKKTITGWPQLASAVTLGGAMVTDVCRRMLLQKPITSGRFFIDFADLIN